MNTRFVDMERITREIKEIAAKYNVPVEVSCQRKDIAAVDLRKDVIFALQQIPDGKDARIKLTIVKCRPSAGKE